MKVSCKVRRSVYFVAGAAVFVFSGYVAASQNHEREDSKQLVQQITDELKTAREQLSKVDTDSTGHKYKLEQLLDQAERETRDLAGSLEHRR